MKKGKKAAIIIIAVIAAAAIVVGGLVLGGVIPVGNKRTASAQEIAVDDTAMTAYKTIPQVLQDYTQIALRHERRRCCKVL